MTTETTELMKYAENSDVLMAPNSAAGLVSRGEIVNLIVVQYIDDQQGRIAEAARETEAAKTSCAEAWNKAYRAWYAEILSRATVRLNPWRDAVIAALGVPVSELSSDELPLPDRCGIDEHGVQCPSRDRSHGVSRVSIGDVIRAWVTHSARTVTPADPSAPTRVSTYGQRGGDSETVNLSAFRMQWTFAEKDAKYSSDWHSLVLDFDVTPSPEVSVLLSDALAGHIAYQKAYGRGSRLQTEIADGNIKTLERRALAQLTRQALGAAVTVPRLG